MFQDFSDDVLENEVVPVLLSFPNVVITSHQAFFTLSLIHIWHAKPPLTL